MNYHNSRLNLVLKVRMIEQGPGLPHGHTPRPSEAQAQKDTKPERLHQSSPGVQWARSPPLRAARRKAGSTMKKAVSLQKCKGCLMGNPTTVWSPRLNDTLAGQPSRQRKYLPLSSLESCAGPGENTRPKNTDSPNQRMRLRHSRSRRRHSLTVLQRSSRNKRRP